MCWYLGYKCLVIFKSKIVIIINNALNVHEGELL